MSSQTKCLGLSFETINNELCHLEGVKTIFDTWQSLNTHVKIFLFNAVEMSGCLKPKLGQKPVASGHIRQVLA